jgi:hypothetical protein
VQRRLGFGSGINLLIEYPNSIEHVKPLLFETQGL